MFTVQYTERSIKSLQKIPRKWQEKILKAIEGLKKDPYQGKKLHGELKGCFSLRIWPYRVIFLIKKQQITIIILDIGHRQNIYK